MIGEGTLALISNLSLTESANNQDNEPELFDKGYQQADFQPEMTKETVLVIGNMKNCRILYGHCRHLNSERKHHPHLIQRDHAWTN